MRPFGREKKIKGGAGYSIGNWKKDHHVHRNHRKIGNWWEDMCTFLSRSMMKQNWKKNLDKDE